MRRLGALVGAVAMVVIALVVRDSIGGDGTAAESTGGDGLVCPAQFDDICTGVDAGASIAGAGDTADTLISATSADALDGQAWIVPAAWARLVVAQRDFEGAAPLFEVLDDPLASSPVIIAAWTDRADAIASACNRPLDWRCLAEQAGTQVLGNPVRIGAPTVESAGGLTVAAAQAANLLGTSDFASNDFDGSDFRTLAERLGSGQTTDPLGTMRLQGPGRLTAVGIIAADAQSLTSSLGTINRYVDASPTVRADVVALVPAGATLDGRTRSALTAAFVAAGWDPPGDGPDGLPSGGVLAAVRALWNDNR